MNDEVEVLKQEARRAEEAKRVLQSESFIEAFEALRRDLTQQMSAVKATDEKTKSKLIDMWQLVNSLELWFITTIETGEAAELHLEEKKRFGIWPK